MPSKYVHTEVEGRKLKLSNLDKVLFPDPGILKAEVVQYYMEVADDFLFHIRDRPLTLIRYPDGVHKQKFYAKEKPKWTPEWIESVKIEHSKEPINYLVARSKATVIWLANLAALEIHPMQMTIDSMDNPDHYIFDLDPPESQGFEHVKEIAFALRDFLEKYDYTPFVKTSGGKGLHILVPIEPLYTHEEMVDSVKTLAQKFVQENKASCTLNIQKEKRQGKTLIDIYRNHMAQTTVAPYSLRGKPSAPISMPLSWEKLEEIEDSQHFTLRNYRDYLEESRTAWADYASSAAKLHDNTSEIQVDPEIEKKLADYIEKRNFENTPEPGLTAEKVTNDRYVIQLHDASNLHYDLRLEIDGVLKSWAIPKGLPIRKGIKRMAIETEPHPLKYLNFEGVIPKGEYGAGSMWIYETGKYTTTELTKDKIAFSLIQKKSKTDYLIFRTRDNQWLIERKSPATALLLDHNPKPMLADMSKELPTGPQFAYEIKWDGIRALIHLEEDSVKIISRSGRDITSAFPELCDARLCFDVHSGIFDGEIVVLDPEGRPVFSKVISRMHTKGKEAILLKSKTLPVVCYIFDCLELDGKNITQLPFHRRVAWLNACIKRSGSYRISEAIDDGQGLFKAARAMQLEGVMAKDKNARYSPGSRTRAWLKVKYRETADCLILGYTKGKGARSNLFGAIHLGVEQEEGKIQYMGKVGGGFDEKKMIEILARFEEIGEGPKLVDDKIEEEKDTTWLNAVLYCEIKYASLTNNNTYREPVFLRFRDDLIKK